MEKDLKYLEGKQVYLIKYPSRQIELMEVALLERGMGVTLKGVNTHVSVCINGPESPNKKAYNQFKDIYEEDFEFLSKNIQTGVIDWDTHMRSQPTQYLPSGSGKIVCATGMPV